MYVQSNEIRAVNGCKGDGPTRDNVSNIYLQWNQKHWYTVRGQKTSVHPMCSLNWLFIFFVTYICESVIELSMLHQIPPDCQNCRDPLGKGSLAYRRYNCERLISYVLAWSVVQCAHGRTVINQVFKWKRETVYSSCTLLWNYWCENASRFRSYTTWTTDFRIVLILRSIFILFCIFFFYFTIRCSTD